MPQLAKDEKKILAGIVKAMDDEFAQWHPHFQQLAEYLLPRRYEGLAVAALKSSTSAHGLSVNQASKRASASVNSKILDSSATLSLRTLAAGLLNGITSPTRPWLRLKQAGAFGTIPQAHVAFFEEVARRMLSVMAESNFYNSMAILYLDLCAFGTAAMLIYEDFDEVIRCYNSPMGEYRIAQSDRKTVDMASRRFSMTLRQMIQKWGVGALPEKLQQEAKKGGAKLFVPYTISHLIEPNSQDDARKLPKRFAMRELYWLADDTSDHILSVKGFVDNLGMFPRWELTGSDTWGTSPGMDALADVKQLQHETLRKAQALDIMTRPPVILEGYMKRQGGASLLPGGKTYAPAGASFGAKPIFTVNPPIGEINQDIASTQARIARIFHNDLFAMISNLDTVRSATEIDARKEEKLVLLGAVLERFENEALDPAIRRIYSILLRKGLLPEAPEGLNPEEIEIEYVSVMSDAQKAVGTVSVERFAEFLGNLAGINPELLDVVDWDDLIRGYAERLNVPASNIRAAEDVQTDRKQNAELAQTREAALVGGELTNAAKNLSETDVGGGQSALAAVLGS